MTPKKQAVLEAATSLFAKKGYEHTDVETIAAAAGVAKGTVFFHFQTKQKLFMAVADLGMTRLVEHVLASIEGLTDPVEILRSAGLASAGFFQQQPELVEIMLQERTQFRGSIPDTHILYREKNRAVFERYLQQGVEQGVFREIDIGEALIVGANMLYGLVVTSCIEGKAHEITARARYSIELFLRSILAEPPD
ncbi:MAG: TetR/AcrR family transcriptional regulator [Pirellulales bacterium]